MAYATGRRFLDADSHIMELPNFLTEHAEAEIRDRLPAPAFSSGGRLADALGKAQETGGHTPETVEELLGLGDGLISGPKGYEALGAFNPSERSQALDLLGFECQLVFSTFTAISAFDTNLDPEVRAGAARAHNRAMAAFCQDDERLLGVATIALDDPEAAVAELEHVLSLGLQAVWIPHRLAGGSSPGHDRLDPFWARLAEARMPAVLHVGGTGLQLAPGWMDTGRAVPTDWLGGGENVRGKDMIALHHNVEKFLGALVLDGVLERHRDLRVGVIELGAGWVPAMLRRLDHIAEIWRRSEPELAALTRRPSEQIVEQMAFTPYPFEDVGTLVAESDDRLYLFSSDYPHVEGGRNPLARFERSLSGHSPATLDRFYSANMGDLLGL